MSMQPIDILGGESVYCIKEDQLARSFELAQRDPVSSPRIQAAIGELESTLTRNERAALAFVLIDRLLNSAPSA
jgi:hypothetical protein